MSRSRHLRGAPGRRRTLARTATAHRRAAPRPARPNRQFQQRRTPSLIVVGSSRAGGVLVGDGAVGRWDATAIDGGTIKSVDPTATPASTADASAARRPARRPTSCASTPATPTATAPRTTRRPPTRIDGSAVARRGRRSATHQYFDGKRGVGLVVDARCNAGDRNVRVDVGSAPWIVDVYASAAMLPATIERGAPSLASYSSTSVGTVSRPARPPGSPRARAAPLQQRGGDAGCSPANPYRGAHRRDRVRGRRRDAAPDDRSSSPQRSAAIAASLDELLRRHYDRIYARVPADHGQRSRRGRRGAGGHDRDRARPGPFDGRAASARGCTASRPTPASTSCAAGGGDRCRPSRRDRRRSGASRREHVDPTQGRHGRGRRPDGARRRAGRAAERLPDPDRAARRRRTSTTPRSPTCSAIPVGTVKSRIARGRASLAATLRRPGTTTRPDERQTQAP